MAGDQFRLGFGERRELGGNRLRRGAMQFLAARPQQGLVGCVLDQRVLEQVGGPWRGPAAKQQAGAGQRAQRRLQIGLRPRGCATRAISP